MVLFPRSYRPTKWTRLIGTTPAGPGLSRRKGETEGVHGPRVTYEGTAGRWGIHQGSPFRRLARVTARQGGFAAGLAPSPRFPERPGSCPALVSSHWRP